MKVALISLNQAWEDKEQNKASCSNYIHLASLAGCVTAVFPEMTLTGFTMNSSAIAENLTDSDTICFFSGLALKFNINIIFGMVIKNEPLPVNCAMVMSDSGKVISSYAKIHPFSYAEEDKFFSSGETLSFCKIGDCNFGISICYDLRFPELYQGFSKRAEVIVNIANWPASRIEHWDVLLRARAIENQVFLIGANRVGTDGNRISYIKSSKIFNPYGDELIPVSTDEEIDVYDLDLSQIEFFRAKFPFRRDRKANLYKSIL